eukprot:tig00001003_g6282.t1
MIQLPLFFRPAAEDALHAELQSLCAALPPCDRALLHGPDESGTTSLLFTYAFNCARAGRAVYFIADKQRLNKIRPSLHEGIDGDDPALARCGMKWIRTSEALFGFLANAHLIPRQQMPSLIVLESVLQYFPEGTRPTPEGIARLLGFLDDAARAVSAISCQECEVLVGSGGLLDASCVAIAEFWLPLIFIAGGANPCLLSTCGVHAAYSYALSSPDEHFRLLGASATRPDAPPLPDPPNDEASA